MESRLGHFQAKYFTRKYANILTKCFYLRPLYRCFKSCTTKFPNTTLWNFLKHNRGMCSNNRDTISIN